MRHELDDDDEEIHSHQEHELTLSTGAILGIFFALVLLCGAFFGFGYKIGSHKSAPPVESSAVETTTTPTANFNAFKPAAGSPAGNNSSAAIAAKPAQQAPQVATDSPSLDAPPEAAPVVHAPPSTTVHTIAPTVPAPVAAGSFLVQVAAVSHKEDADLLVGALKAKGYPVASYPEPDKLFHIQIGPFNNRKDAEATRQRLLADGYQPILK
jgi:cell division septation protein DedD